MDGHGRPVQDLEKVAQDFAAKDVVFIGEVHEHPLAHQQYLELFMLLHARRPHMVLSMEMFEQDVQGALDAYLDGRITAAEFAKQGRAQAWGEWERDYAPMLEFAVQHNVPVVAANVPRVLAGKVSRQGLAAVQEQDLDYLPAEVEAAAEGPNWDAFCEAITEDSDDEWEEDLLRRFYEAQCIKDEAMAEAIAYQFAGSGKLSRPLVLHINGNFHSDHGRGVVERLLRRRPDLAVGIFSTKDVEQLQAYLPEPGVADYVLVVREEPEEEERVHPKVKPHVAKPESEGEHGGEHGGEYGDEYSGRPALGFYPGYDPDDEPGVLVQQVTSGGMADQAGIEDGDRIISLDGEEVEEITTYTEILSSLTIGSKVSVIVMRGDKKLDLQVTVGERPH